MTRPGAGPRGDDAIAFAERVLGILELGSFSATYKYALFNAILDLCIERTSRSGVPPTTLTTRQIAEKVIELYWPHAIPYEGGRVLRQFGGRTEKQATIVREIQEYRAECAGTPEDRFYRSKLARSDRFKALVRSVEWTLIKYPIPRLQVVGENEETFLYGYGWDTEVSKREVSAYQHGDTQAFDNRLHLRSGVPEHLLRLGGILRPLMHREWVTKVADMNSLQESKLEEFLFGVSRSSLNAVRNPLRDLQSNRCFYCSALLAGPTEVDHFIPWARYPDNGLDNLVVAHRACNKRKWDFLAAADHVERWSARNLVHGSDLTTVSKNCEWERDRERSRAVAIASYSRLPATARLWLEGSSLVPVERARIDGALRRMA